jgi:uncharacterized protein YjiS (DUF1127 family)
MAAIVPRDASRATRLFPVALVALISRIVKSLSRSVKIRRQRRLLQQLPDVVLMDVGVSRSGIDSIVTTIVDGKAHPSDQRRGRRQTIRRKSSC